jgi:hypothetical protein
MNAPAKLFMAAWVAACLGALGGVGGCEGGTSSETVGMAEATPAADQIAVRTDAGNSVGLYSADFLPFSDSGFSSSATADSNGMALFPQLVPGRYQVVVRQTSGGKAALISDLAVPASGKMTARARLEATGTLAGAITDSLPAFVGVIYVPGTPFFALGDSLMRYELSGLPQGIYPIIKTWKQPLACDSSRTCGGNVARRDSTLVRIRPGENATW